MRSKDLEFLLICIQIIEEKKFISTRRVAFKPPPPGFFYSTVLLFCQKWQCLNNKNQFLEKKVLRKGKSNDRSGC